MPVRHTNKEMRKILAALVRSGHKISQNGGHIKIRHGSTGRVTRMSGTPSDANAYKNAVRQLINDGYLDRNPLVAEPRRVKSGNGTPVVSVRAEIDSLLQQAGELVVRMNELEGEERWAVVRLPFPPTPEEEQPVIEQTAATNTDDVLIEVMQQLVAQGMSEDEALNMIGELQ